MKNFCKTITVMLIFLAPFSLLIGCPPPPDVAITGSYGEDNSDGNSSFITAEVVPPTNAIYFTADIIQKGFTFEPITPAFYDFFFFEGHCVGSQSGNKVTSFCMYPGPPGSPPLLIAFLNFVIEGHDPGGNHCVTSMKVSGISSIWYLFWGISSPHSVERYPVGSDCENLQGQCLLKEFCEHFPGPIQVP